MKPDEGDELGELVGNNDGLWLEWTVGERLGSKLGILEEINDGIMEGILLTTEDGFDVGAAEGHFDGESVWHSGWTHWTLIQLEL